MAEVNVIAPDGTPGTLPEEELQSALADGFRIEGAGAPDAAVAAPELDEVEVRAPDGSVGTVARSELAAALADGFEETATDRYRTGGQKAATAAEGFGRGATLGISDAVQTAGAGIGTALGNMLADATLPETPRAAGPGIDAPLAAPTEHDLFDEAAQAEAYQDIQGRREANPALAATAEVGGALTAAALSGGVGSVGAMARVTPAGQLANLATKMGTALTARAGGALGRVGALTLTGAAEGAVDMATRRVMDDLAAGNVEITAERVLDAAWDGARWGGLAAGGLGLAAEGVGAAARGVGRAYDATADAIRARRAGGTSGPVAVSDVADDAAGAARVVADDAAPGITEEVIERATVDPSGAQEAMGPLSTNAINDNDAGGLRNLFAKARAAEGAFEAGQQGAVRTVRKDMDRLLKNVDEIDELAGIAAKRRASSEFDGWGRSVDSTDVVNAFDAVDSRLKELVGEVGEAALQDRGGLAALRRSQQLISHAKKTAAEKLAQGDIGSAYMVMDDLKRGLGHAQNTRNSIAQTVLREEYDKFRLFLENEGRWGDLAKAQKRVNPAWTERIRRQNDQRVGGFFVRSGDSGLDPFETLKQSNDASIGALLNQLGQAESEGTEEALRRYLRATAIDAETRAATWGSAELVDKAREIKDAVEKIESSMNAVGLLKRDAKGWQEIKKGLDWMPFAGQALSAGARAAHAVENRTASTIRRLARGAVKQEQAVEAAVGATIRSITQPATRVVPLATKGAVPAANIEQLVSQARALQDPESPESHQLEAMTLQMASESPDFADAMRNAVRRKADFVVRTLGPQTDPNDPSGTSRVNADRVTRGRRERFLQAAASPTAAMERLASGRGSAEDLAVVRELTPQVHKAWVDRVLGQIQSGQIKPTIAQRQRLLASLGVPVYREQTPDYVQFFQQLVQGAGQPQDQQAPQGLPPERQPKFDGRDFKVDQHFAGRADALAGGPDA
jgi:hypothetical protein